MKVMNSAVAIVLTTSIAAVAQSDLPPIYDTQADGKQQITDAVAAAKRQNKRILLQFGANWCIWCHRLHSLFDTNEEIAKKLEAEYELVLIDVDKVDGKEHNADVDAHYGRPTRHGLPTLVVLDTDGRQLTTRETAAWEVGEGYDADKVLSFLKRWQPPRASAGAELSSALARAKANSRSVFLWFGAPWCGFCKRMTEYLHREEIETLFNSEFAPVKIDIERMDGGRELATQHGWTEKDGLPFFVVLDSAGKKLADSRGPQGNVGFPVEPHEIAHFMDVIRQTAGNLTPAQLTTLEQPLHEPDPRSASKD